MNTKTATKPVEMTETLGPGESREVAVFQPPRLPYHQALKERFDIEPSGWKALVEAVYPSAKTIDAVVMALSYCKARNLDPFKRPVHIVPMWSPKGGRDGKGGYVETIWPGIAELRTTAFRTGNYAGCDEAEFGPKISKVFKGKLKKKGRNGDADKWEDTQITLEFPEWCRITVYRLLGTRVCKFVGPKVLWLESYATIGRSELPNEMWGDRTDGQIEKCAEAAALRRAFPEEIGNELTAEEMYGRVLNHGDDANAVEQQPTRSGPPSPDAVKGNAQPNQLTQAKAQPDVIDVEVEDVEALPLEDEDTVTTQPAQAQTRTEEKPQQQSQPDGFTDAEREWLREVDGALSGCEDHLTLAEKQASVMAPKKSEVSAAAWAKAKKIQEGHFTRIQEADVDDIPGFLQRSQQSKDVEANRVGLFEVLKDEIAINLDSMDACLLWARNNAVTGRLKQLTREQAGEIDRLFSAKQKTFKKA